MLLSRAWRIMSMWHYQGEVSPNYPWNYYSWPFLSPLPGDHSENINLVSLWQNNIDLNPKQNVQIPGNSHFVKLTYIMNTLTLYIHCDANYFSGDVLGKGLRLRCKSRGAESMVCEYVYTYFSTVRSIFRPRCYVPGHRTDEQKASDILYLWGSQDYKPCLSCKARHTLWPLTCIRLVQK